MKNAVFFKSLVLMLLIGAVGSIFRGAAFVVNAFVETPAIGIGHPFMTLFARAVVFFFGVASIYLGYFVIKMTWLGSTIVIKKAA